MTEHGIITASMKKNAVLMTLLFFWLGGCSLFRKSPPPYPEGPIFPMVKKAETTFRGDVIESVRQSGSILYFSARPDFVYSYDMEKRRILWQINTTEQLISAPYMGENALYVVGEAGTLFRLGLDGGEQWRKNFSFPITSGVCELKNQVVVGIESGEVKALDVATAEPRWTFSSAGAVRSNITDWKGNLLCGSEQGVLYIINSEGKAVRKYQVDGVIGANLKVDEDRVYFGTENRFYYALNLRKMKKKWVRRLGGPVRVPAAVEGKYLYLTCWDGVIYCIAKKRGSVEWWRSLPSRSMFSPVIASDRVVATAHSPRLDGFIRKDGESTGYFVADSEIRANAVWKESEILVPLFDYDTRQGFLLHLVKEVTVKLTPALASPQVVGTEISLSVSAVGFYMAKFRFYVVSVDKKSVLQEESTQNTYAWFPDKAGSYRLGVTVFDAREERTVEIPFVINPKVEKRTEKEEKK